MRLIALLILLTPLWAAAQAPAPAAAPAPTPAPTPIERLQAVLASPYEDHPGHEDLAALPPDWAASIEISCSS